MVRGLTRSSLTAVRGELGNSMSVVLAEMGTAPLSQLAVVLQLLLTPLPPIQVLVAREKAGQESAAAIAEAIQIILGRFFMNFSCDEGWRGRTKMTRPQSRARGRMK